NTPIAVPSVVPTRHQSRFCAVSATAKPFASWDKTSMSAPRLEPEQAVERVLENAGADINAERLGKAEIGDQRKRRADAGIAQDRLGAEAARDADEQHDGRNRETGIADEQNVERETSDDPKQGRPVGRDLFFFLGLPAALERREEQQQSKHRETKRGDVGNDRRPDLGIDRRDRDDRGLPDDDGSEHKHPGRDDRLADGGPKPTAALSALRPLARHLSRARAL